LIQELRYKIGRSLGIRQSQTLLVFNQPSTRTKVHSIVHATHTKREIQYAINTSWITDNEYVTEIITSSCIRKAYVSIIRTNYTVFL